MTGDYMADQYILDLILSGSQEKAYQTITAYDSREKIENPSSDADWEYRLLHPKENLFPYYADIEGIRHLEVFENKEKNNLYIAMNIFSLLYIGSTVKRGYAESRITDFYHPAAKDDIKKACGEMQDKYKNFAYPSKPDFDRLIDENFKVYSKALDDYSASRDLITMYFHMANAYETAGLIDKAIPLWEKMLELGDDGTRIVYIKLKERYEEFKMNDAVKRIEKLWKKTGVQQPI